MVEAKSIDSRGGKSNEKDEPESQEGMTQGESPKSIDGLSFEPARVQRSLGHPASLNMRNIAKSKAAKS